MIRKECGVAFDGKSTIDDPLLSGQLTKDEGQGRPGQVKCQKNSSLQRKPNDKFLCDNDVLAIKYKLL